MSECPICGGVGLVEVVSASGRWVSRACECQEMERFQRRLGAARIPERYLHCSLDSYETVFRGQYGASSFKNRHAADKPQADPSLGKALMTARSYVKEYPTDTERKGLLFTGSIGVGKTHLAVGVLSRLVQEYDAKGLFCDYRELLKSIQNSYNPQVQTTELELLKPVFAAEVLVLDDLGAQKPSEWMWDTVALILNTRYNNKQRTIITTNYANRPAGGGEKSDAERAARELTLGDRIGDRMLSRLAEMCIPVEVSGVDFRQLIKGAHPR
ncbi:MAG: ATP-binding protein [Terracidiphilus sp.]|jgi:DNA replication protein DnaC